MPGTAAFRRTVEEHLDVVAALLAPLAPRPAETVALDAALGRVLAADVTSPVPMPLFRNAQMDGFAVRAADLASAPVRMPIAVDEIAAGPGMPGALAAGTAARIMTGAPVPAGADAVVPVERTRVDGGVVEFAEPVEAGRYVREAGSDLPAGRTLLTAGTRLASRHLAGLAAAGLGAASVRSRVRVAVLSSGSELVGVGAVPRAGELFDANGPALAAAAVEAGAAVVHRARVRDDTVRFRAELDAAVDAGAELVVTSGGVSMGEHEVVRETLEPLGAEVGGVAMQPGGPQGHARYRGVPLLCFPGNPVSSQVSFALFAAPALRSAAGLPPMRRSCERAAIAIPLFDARRRQFQRGARTADGRVAPVGGPGSHLVAALASSELLIVVPAGGEGIQEDDEVEVLWLD